MSRCRTVSALTNVATCFYRDQFRDFDTNNQLNGSIDAASIVLNIQLDINIKIIWVSSIMREILT